MPIALALIAAIVYGASDFLGGLASRRTATIGVVIWSQAVGLALLALVVPAFGGHATLADVRWGALCGVAGALAIVALYRGLAIGTMGAGARLARPAVGLVVLCGALDVSANVLYVVAAHHALLALVAVLTSLYPAATVALAAIALRERLGRLQWIGVALALGGAVAISSGS